MSRWIKKIRKSSQYRSLCSEAKRENEQTMQMTVKNTRGRKLKAGSVVHWQLSCLSLPYCLSRVGSCLSMDDGVMLEFRYLLINGMLHTVSPCLCLYMCGRAFPNIQHVQSLHHGTHDHRYTTFTRQMVPREAAKRALLRGLCLVAHSRIHKCA